MSLDPSYYYFQFEDSFASFVLSKVPFPKSSWICEFMHHLQCIVQAMKYTKCAQFCSGGVATCLTLELDVCQVVLSHGMDEMLCKGWECFTSDLHPIASMPLGESPQFLFVSSWTGCSAPCFPFPSHPTCFPPLQYGYPLRHASVSLNLLGSTSCGWLGRACMPAGQLMCTRGWVGWPLPD